MTVSATHSTPPPARGGGDATGTDRRDDGIKCPSCGEKMGERMPYGRVLWLGKSVQGGPTEETLAFCPVCPQGYRRWKPQRP